MILYDNGKVSIVKKSRKAKPAPKPMTPHEAAENELAAINSLCAKYSGWPEFERFDEQRKAVIRKVEAFRPLSQWERLCLGEGYDEAIANANRLGGKRDVETGK